MNDTRLLSPSGSSSTTACPNDSWLDRQTATPAATPNCGRLPWAAIVGGWVVRIPLAVVLGVWGGYGILLVWLTMVLDWAVRAVLMGWRLSRLDWARIRL